MPENSCRFEGCTLTGALSITASVQDSVTIVHGPAGCAHHNFSLFHTICLDNNEIHVPRLVSSGMLEPEIVFGGEEALRTAIRSATAQDIRSVFVLSSCIAETIGDDVNAVCHEGWDFPVIPVPTSGFLGGSFQKGVNNALLALLGMVKPVSPGECNGRVNIVGEKNLEYEVEENYAEVARLLSLLDLEVNLRFVRQISTDDLNQLGSGSLNVLRDAGVIPVGNEICNRFQISSIPGFPEGFSGTMSFLARTGTACGIDVRDAVEEETEFQQAVLTQFSGFAGAEICLAPAAGMQTGPPQVLEAARLLGMTVASDGIPVPLPLAPPIGTQGMKRMLHRWRRALNA